jgi:hypothetical protein
VDAGTCESVEGSYTHCGKEEFYANITCGNCGKLEGGLIVLRLFNLLQKIV